MSYHLREAVAAFRRTPILVALSAMMIGLAIYVFGLFGLVAHNLDLALTQVEERVEVVAYLRDDTSPEELDRVIEDISSLPEVRIVHYVSKAQALERARGELSGFEEVFSDVDINPLPSSLEIEFRSGSRDPDAVEGVALQAQAYPFVEEVQFGQGWVDQLFTIRRIGALTTTVLGGAFAIVATLIIGFAIRMAIFARREEISIMRLVGAKNNFIRLPFLLEGGLTGLLGGMLAALLTYATFETVSGFLFSVSWIPSTWTVLGIALGGLIGFAASGFALRRYLREV